MHGRVKYRLALDMSKIYKWRCVRLKGLKFVPIWNHSCESKNFVLLIKLFYDIFFKTDSEFRFEKMANFFKLQSVIIFCII